MASTLTDTLLYNNNNSEPRKKKAPRNTEQVRIFDYPVGIYTAKL